MQEIKLNDIADGLLILNKITIDKLFQLENSADCIALYVFYYKTAKWQKTNQPKANACPFRPKQDRIPRQEACPQAFSYSLLSVSDTL